jgi:hypothetical protein
MRAKLTFREKWSGFLGFSYRVNLNTKEVHRLESKHINCLKSDRKNTMYVTEKTANMFVDKREFNGCKWCWRSKDTDKIKR